MGQKRCLISSKVFRNAFLQEMKAGYMPIIQRQFMSRANIVPIVMQDKKNTRNYFKNHGYMDNFLLLSR